MKNGFYALAALLLLQTSTAIAKDLNFRDAAIMVYPSSYNLKQGQRLDLHVSSAEAYKVEIFHFGKQRQLKLTLNSDEAQWHPVPDKPWQTNFDWPVAHQIELPQSWPSGMYEVRVTDKSGDSMALKLTLGEDKPGSQSKTLLLDMFTTTVAYDRFGGKSMYSSQLGDGKRAQIMSLKRPIIDTDFGWMWKFVAWADHQAIDLELASTLDLHQDPELLSHYDTLVLAGHNEYWSAPMRDQLDAFVANGGRVLIFSGNTMWWQIRFDEQGRMVCYKSANDDPMAKTNPRLTTTNFYAEPVNWPENTTIGVSFRHGGFVNYDGRYTPETGHGGYKVSEAEHWVFDNTGLSNGDTFGIKAPIVGYEVDSALFELVDGKPVVTGEDQTPKNFSILAWAPAFFDDDYQRHATLGIFPKGDKGGWVFNAATTDWADGLYDLNARKVVDETVSQITLNLLNKAKERANTTPPNGNGSENGGGENANGGENGGGENAGGGENGSGENANGGESGNQTPNNNETPEQPNNGGANNGDGGSGTQPSDNGGSGGGSLSGLLLAGLLARRLLGKRGA